MRRLTLALFLTLAVTPLVAQVHEATPLDVLMERVHMMAMPAYTEAQTAMLPVPEAATKVFDLDAHRFSYGVNPSPFVVNQGDTVTLNITAADTTHGWSLETYDPAFTNIAKGSTHTVQFVANTAGTFTFFCTFFCGDGHPGMSGVFTVNAAVSTAPTISTVSPSTGSTAGGTTVTIKGTNFATGATVKLGGRDVLNVNVVDATTITFVTPLGPTSELAGMPQDITVTNSDAQTVTKSQAFSYVVPAPAITSLSPAVGVLTGGTTVTVTGVGFTTAVVTTVTFGGGAATNVNVLDAVTLTAVAPAHAAGQVDVTVKVGNNSTTKASGFTYVKSSGHRRSVRP